MGNATITIHHPTSLSHGEPYPESGKVAQSIPGKIQLVKREGTAVGCGGRVIFKKIVKESHYTYTITNTNSANLEIGREISITAGDIEEAESKISATYGLSKTEVRETTTMTSVIVSDDNDYSELYCYVNYYGKDKGEVRWTKNDLHLTYSCRWAEASEMIIDINFHHGSGRVLPFRPPPYLEDPPETPGHLRPPDRRDPRIPETPGHPRLPDRQDPRIPETPGHPRPPDRRDPGSPRLPRPPYPGGPLETPGP